MQRNEILEQGATLCMRRKPNPEIFRFTLVRRIPYNNPSFTGELWKCIDERGQLCAKSFYKCENIDKILE